MNVTKMRHQLQRTTDVAEQRERDRWLATLTPEHRRKHVGRFAAFGMCFECFTLRSATP